MADKSRWEVAVIRAVQFAAMAIILLPVGTWAQIIDQTDFKRITEQKLEELTENIFDTGPGDAENQIAWPPWRGYHTMACNGNRLLLAGGTVGGRLPKPSGNPGIVVEYNFEAGQWTVVSTTLFGGDNMVFLPPLHKFIRYRASTSAPPTLDNLDGDTYSLDVRTGIQENLNPQPPAPFALEGGHGKMVYDSRAEKIVMFGGLDYVQFLKFLTGNCDQACFSSIFRNDTWVYDLRTNGWTLMHPPVSPPPRNSHMLTYDKRADRVILFGGGDFFQDFEDTWAYDYENDAWTQLQPATHPSARAYGSFKYDSERGVSVLFGGVDYNEALTDNVVWSFDYFENEWTSAPNLDGPTARGWHDMAYCSDGDNSESDNSEGSAFYLYGGGVNRRSFTDELWVYHTRSNSWLQIPKH